jgi:uncharacterized membrane protein HdeD (DUF308 family)
MIEVNIRERPMAIDPWRPLAEMEKAETESGFDRRDRRSAVLARNWGLVLLRGLIGVVAGGVALLMPDATLQALLLLFVAYLLFDGITAIASAIRAAQRHERWGMCILEGAVGLAAAVLVYLMPSVAIWTLVLAMAAWAIVSGALMLAAAYQIRADHGRFWLGFGGAVSVLWGMTLVAEPRLGAVLLTMWLGAYALIFGITLIIVALHLRRSSLRGGVF